ncbi:hypothetical protein CAEBREN_21348 [Caenorhabditis brenneri]|uniref:Uncharacterized protein n=1 Tax=Caenorhabditis brenneri TaxID=135651 RepID=G0NHM7_CAEBE|nr:hypothetical protein CAEBREN_21348 [Caenorhabditis brenneri]
MEDSRSDDERPEQKEEDPGATRRDDTAGQDTQGPREPEDREGPSTSDAAARRESDEAVSKPEVPTETQEPGGQEGPSTSDAPAKQESDEAVSETESPTETQEEGEASQTTRNADQDTECCPASTVNSQEESESPEQMDSLVASPVDPPEEVNSTVDSSASAGSQLSESAQSPETAAKIESNETVSETESPTEIQEEGEANQTPRNTDQNTGSRPNTSVEPLEGLESTEQMDSLESSTVAPPAVPSATNSAQPSESAQLEGYSPLPERAPVQPPLPPYAPEAGKGPPPPSYHPRSPRDENSTDSLAPAYQRPLPIPPNASATGGNAVDEARRQEGREANQAARNTGQNTVGNADQGANIERTDPPPQTDPEAGCLEACNCTIT